MIPNGLGFAFAAVCLTAVPSLDAQRSQATRPRSSSRPPILDMHLHTRNASHYGPTKLPMCAPVERMPRWDQRKPFGEDGSPPPCRNAFFSAETDAEIVRGTIVRMERYNIYGVLGGDPASVASWMKAAPGRFIPSLDLRFDPATATAREATSAELPIRPLPVDSIGALHERGAFRVLAEVMNQYAGISPDDPRLEPLWKLAEQLDIPVGIHIGGGGPAEAYVGSKAFRARLQSALTLEEVLIKHPKLRVYIMHGGYPLLEDLLALLFSHPQVYVELSMAANVETRAAYYRYLKGIVEAGYGDRVMFGSDQMIWPELIDAAVRSLEEAPFLTAAQKRDIFYNNAARFLRLSEAEIARHHGR